MTQQSTVSGCNTSSCQNVDFSFPPLTKSQRLIKEKRIAWAERPMEGDTNYLDPKNQTSNSSPEQSTDDVFAQLVAKMLMGIPDREIKDLKINVKHSIIQALYHTQQ